MTALLADDQKRYIFLPLYGAIFGMELTDDALQISRPGQQIPFAELTESGRNIQQDTPDVSNRETHMLGLYLTQFQKAREILRNTIENQASWLEAKRRNGTDLLHVGASNRGVGQRSIGTRLHMNLCDQTIHEPNRMPGDFAVNSTRAVVAVAFHQLVGQSKRDSDPNQTTGEFYQRAEQIARSVSAH